MCWPNWSPGGVGGTPGRGALAGRDVPALASALTWLGERLYHLAAIGTPPFDDQDRNWAGARVSLMQPSPFSQAAAWYSTASAPASA